MSTVKRFNDWPAAVKAADQLAADLGVKFRVRREPIPVYGFSWWIVEPSSGPRGGLLAGPRQRAATVEELHRFAAASSVAAKNRRTDPRAT